MPYAPADQPAFSETPWRLRSRNGRAPAPCLDTLLPAAQRLPTHQAGCTHQTSALHGPAAGRPPQTPAPHKARAEWSRSAAPAGSPWFLAIPGTGAPIRRTQAHPVAHPAQPPTPARQILRSPGAPTPFPDPDPFPPHPPPCTAPGPKTRAPPPGTPAARNCAGAVLVHRATRAAKAPAGNPETAPPIRSSRDASACPESPDRPRISRLGELQDRR